MRVIKMHVGFIGLGNVGGKLSGSLLRNGIKLSVHDLDKDLVENFVSREQIMEKIHKVLWRNVMLS